MGAYPERRRHPGKCNLKFEEILSFHRTKIKLQQMVFKNTLIAMSKGR